MKAFKMGVLASACIFAWNCGDDSSSNPPAEISSSSGQMTCDLSAYGTLPLWTGAYLVYADGSVSDGTNAVGTFDFSTGNVLDASGATIATLDASILPWFDGEKLIYRNCLVTALDGSTLGRIDETGNYVPGAVEISSSSEEPILLRKRSIRIPRRRSRFLREKSLQVRAARLWLAPARKFPAPAQWIRAVTKS